MTVKMVTSYNNRSNGTGLQVRGKKERVTGKVHNAN